MSNAQSAELIFSSNRAEAGATPVAAAPTPLPQATDQLSLQRILDRIEQLEFALAEAVLHFEAQGSQIAAQPDALQALSHQVQELSRQASVARPAEDPGALRDIVDRLDAAAAARADETAMIAARLSVLEAAADGRATPVETALQRMATQIQKLTDSATARARAEADAAARHLEAEKALTDRHAAHIAQLVDRFTRVEAALKTLPDQTVMDSLRHEIGGEIEKGRQPMLTRLDAVTGMLATLSNDAKAARDNAPDLSTMAEPLMARIDRLDTAAEQRQRELTRELTDLHARPLSASDLTGVRESFARLMVSMQAMHQTRESADEEILSNINALSGDVLAISDRVSAHLGDGAEKLAERLEAFATRVEAASPADVGAVETALAQVTEALAERPAPTLDAETLRDAFSQQMQAVETWMQRQDLLQSTMSDLLATLVERGAGADETVDFVETLRTVIAAGQFSARKQIEEVEARLSAQVCGLVGSLGEDVEPAEELCLDDRRVLDALRDMRRIVAETPAGSDDEAIANQARKLRLTLTETLATIQSGQAAAS